MNLQGMKPMSAVTFGDLKSSLGTVITSLTDKLLQSNQVYVRAKFGDSLMITVDMRWQQRGKNSDQATLAIMCYRTGLVLLRYHFKRDRSRDEGDSKANALITSCSSLSLSLSLSLPPYLSLSLSA